MLCSLDWLMVQGTQRQVETFSWAPSPEGDVFRRSEALRASRSRNTQNPRAVTGCVASYEAVVQLLDTANIEMYRIQLSNLGMNAPAFKEKLICN